MRECTRVTCGPVRAIGLLVGCRVVRRKKRSVEAERRSAEMGVLTSAIIPRYITMPAHYRDAFDQFNGLVRADAAGMRLSGATKAGVAYWCSPRIDGFWLSRFGISAPTAADEPMLAENRAAPKVQDWPGWEVLYVEHLVRDRMLEESQQAIMDQTARVSRGETTFLCLVKFAGVWYLKAARRAEDDILARAAAAGLDPFALVRNEQ